MLPFMLVLGDTHISTLTTSSPASPIAAESEKAHFIAEFDGKNAQMREYDLAGLRLSDNVIW